MVHWDHHGQVNTQMCLQLSFRVQQLLFLILQLYLFRIIHVSFLVSFLFENKFLQLETGTYYCGSVTRSAIAAAISNQTIG